MAPTFHDGQLVLVYKNAKSYQYDDVVVLKKDKSIWVKRIIGLPGDIISLKNGIVKRNGVDLEPYESDKRSDTLFFINNNEIFVIGDNYKSSIDSRSFGPIEQSQVIGKVVLNLRIALPGLNALYHDLVYETISAGVNPP